MCLLYHIKLNLVTKGGRNNLSIKIETITLLFFYNTIIEFYIIV